MTDFKLDIKPDCIKTAPPQLHPFVAFYKDKSVEVKATTSYDAQLRAAELLKVTPKQRRTITVVRADVEYWASSL